MKIPHSRERSPSSDYTRNVKRGMHNQENRRGLFSKPVWIIVSIIGLIGLIFLFTEHTSHVLIALPYLILLACPLLHIFMHRGHGNHDEKHD